MKQQISSTKAPKALGPYSAGVFNRRISILIWTIRRRYQWEFSQ